MSKLITLSVPENITDLLMRNATAPDFRIYTDGMVSDKQQQNIVHMIGSSTQRDLEGDQMSLKALNDMTKAPSNLTVWLNHDYTLPDSIFGSVVGTPKIVHQEGVADLHLAVSVEMENPAAARVKRYIDNGRRLGCSIGCMVTEFEVPDDAGEEDWYKNPIIIHGVQVVEYSVVGIPANQRSWVENAIRGVFTRTLHPSLVPAMKSLWPRAYSDIMETRELSTDSRDFYERQPTRSSTGAKLAWYPEKKMFLFTSKDVERYMSNEEVKEYMSKDVLPTMTPTFTVSDTTSTTTTAHLAMPLTFSSSSTHAINTTIVQPDIIRTACGSTSLPLDMESSWDKGAAHGRVLEWAGGKGNFSKAKMKEVHFRVDGDGSNITDYHLPFADIKNGHPTAIWHAIIAVAGALGGARGGLSSEGDEGAIRSKVAHYYNKAGKTPPWQNEDKSLDEIHTHEHTELQEFKGVAFALNKDGAPGVMVDANGSHDAVLGTHTHFHNIYPGPVDANKSVTTPGAVTPVGGQLHFHEHTHNNDNSHNHAHDDTIEGFKPPVGAQDADRDGDNDVDTTNPSDDLNIGGARQLSLDTEHTQSTLELYNNVGKLLGLPEMPMEKLKELLYPVPPAMDTPPAPITGDGIPNHVQKAMRAIHAHTYSMTGGKVCAGFGTDGSHLTQPGKAPDGSNPVPIHPEHAPHVQKAHDLAHGMSGADNDGDADDLKALLELDIQKEYGPGNAGGATGVGPANLPAHVQKNIQAIHAGLHAMTGGKVCAGVGSDGSHLVAPTQAPNGSYPVPHHPDHAPHVQKSHDILHALTNGMACGMGSTTHMNETNFQDARNTLMDSEGQVAPTDPYGQLRSIEHIVPALDRTAKALEGINIKAMKAEIEGMQKEFAVLKKGIESIYAEASTAAATVAALKNMPLGNPVKHQRTVVSDTATNHTELATLHATPQETLEQALALTSIELVKMNNGMAMSYRKWPNGVGGVVGGGVRPELTQNQFMFMPYDDVLAYRKGLAAAVPMIDDPNGNNW